MSQPADALELSQLAALDGSTADLSGKVLLVVNVASRCGLTPQYTQLVELQEEAAAAGGFTVVGVPCNQFGGQEPGTPEEIATFCETRFSVNFPLLAKQEVNGEGRSPLYRWLVESEAGGGADIGWNFAKFVVDGAGQVVARFEPDIQPKDSRVLEAIAEALGA